MEMKFCPDCGAEVSASAKACPKCGKPLKKKSVLKWVGIVIAVIFVLGVIGSIAGVKENGGSATISAQSSKPSQSAPPAQAKEPTKISLRDLVAAYKANEVAAYDQYNGREFSITARVTNIESIFGKPTITLGGDQFGMGGMVVVLDRDDPFVKNLSKGNTVTVYATPESFLIEQLHAEGRIVSVP